MSICEDKLADQPSKTEEGSYVEYKERLYEVLRKTMNGVQGHKLEMRDCSTLHAAEFDYFEIVREGIYRGCATKPPENAVPESTECLVSAAREFRLSLATEG